MPPSPKRAKRPKVIRVPVQVTPEQKQELEEIARIHRCTVPEVLRRGIPAMKQVALAIQAGATDDLVLSGDELTVKAKQKAIQAFRHRKGPAHAAKAAGVTMRTISYWATSDPVFKQLAEEGAALAVEQVEALLYKQAKKGIIPAIFGILNAKHPDYGQVRPQMMARYLGALFKIVVNRVATFVRPGDLDRFAAELRSDFDDFASASGGGGK